MPRVITLTDGNDVFWGTSADETILARGGADRVGGGGGNDSIDGGSGDDTLGGGSGSDTLAAGSGRNYLHGDDGQDRLLSTGGIDTIDGGGGIDHWFGDYGAATAALRVTVDADASSVTVSNGTTVTAVERMTITTGSTNDTVTGSNQDSDLRVVTGNGNDLVDISTSTDVSISCGAGNDTIRLHWTGTDYSFVSSDGTIEAGAGIDRLTIELNEYEAVHRESVVVASDGDGAFSGSYLFFYGGMVGGYGGTEFFDVERLTLRGSDADESFKVDAAALADGAQLTIDGGHGADSLDIDLSALVGTTFVVSGTGEIASNQGTFANLERYTMTLGRGDDSVTTGAGDDVVIGGGGDDTLSGAGGNDSIAGGYGSDQLTGGTGSDSLDGGARNDTLAGGAGSDTLTGGRGDDVFVFSGLDNGTDVITDWDEGGQDVISIVGYGEALNSFADLNISVGATETRIDLGADVPGAGTIILQGSEGYAPRVDADSFLFV